MINPNRFYLITRPLLKFAKGFGADTVSKNVASRKKRKGGVLKDVGSSWGSEAGDTESDSVDMEKEFLVEKTSVDYGKRNFLGRKNSNQTPKRLRVVTKQALNKPLSKINFLGNNNNDNVLSDGLLELPPPLKNLVNVSVWKLFALDIGLEKVTGRFSQEKLSVVRKLFLGINGFGGASTSSKFAGIIRATFTSESSLMQASKKAGDVKILVNTNFKKSTGQSDQAVMVKEIPVGTSAEVVCAMLSGFSSVVSIKIQLVELWQKAVIKFAQLDQTDLDAVRVVKANLDKESWDARDQYRTLLYTLPMSTNTHNIWDFIGSVSEKTCVIN
ncbi:hypothetical protein G9A89_003094 [Geosiphon pyriformis]|nr:hypothetical protein G9A89_003094 [Geosiphon pyriformis]